MRRWNQGFTLAEVLITLGIIGVVAAMTIPTIINNTQNAEFSTAMKKTYSVLSNATSKMLADNSGTIWDVSPSDQNQLSINMKDAYKQYLYTIQDGTMSSLISISGWYGYKSTTSLVITTGRYGLITKDGTFMRFFSAQNCSGTVPSGLSYCGNITVDTNGNKKPNMMGKDAGIFFLLKDSSNNYKLVPGGTLTGYTCDPETNGSTSQSTSDGCTEYIIYGKPLP